jgi:hypothetical protein
MKDGAHTHGPQGGGGLVVVLIAGALLIGSGAASAAVHAAFILAAAVAAAVVVLGAAAIAWALWRTRSERRRRPITARPVYQLPPEPRPRLEESSKPAIEPPRETHLHFHVSAAELAAIMRHHDERETP